MPLEGLTTGSVPRNVPRALGTAAEQGLEGDGSPNKTPAPVTRSTRDLAMTKVNQRPFGTVRKLPSGRFQARWTGADGHTHTAPTTYPTRDDAKNWLASERTARAEARWIDERITGQPFSVVAGPWRADRERGGYRVATWTRDVEYLDRYISPRWGKTPLDEIEGTDIREWYLELVESGGEDGGPLAPATVHKIGQILGNVLDTAVRAKKLLTNPTKGVPLPRDPDPKEMMILAPFEIDELAALERTPAVWGDGHKIVRPGLPLPEWWRAFVLVGCYCGLRAGELFALRARDVDLNRRIIAVERIVVEVKGKRHAGPPKTRAGRRTVPFPRAVADELAARVAAAPHPDDLIFPNTVGDHVGLSSFRSRVWKVATEKVGLNGFRVHDMRHTAVSLWIAARQDPKTIAAWAGHRSVATVLDRYGHLYDHGDDPMGALDDLLRAGQGRGNVVPIRRGV